MCAAQLQVLREPDVAAAVDDEVDGRRGPARDERRELDEEVLRAAHAKEGAAVAVDAAEVSGIDVVRRVGGQLE